MNETPNDNVSGKFNIKGRANDYSATLTSNIRRALSDYFEGDQKKLVEVKIRRVEENRISGFIKVSSEETQESFLHDFQATSTQQGAISSLEVDGKGIRRNLYRKDRSFNSLKELIASALIGDALAQETLKTGIATKLITIDELKPEIVKSAIGYALGRLRSTKPQEGD